MLIWFTGKFFSPGSPFSAAGPVLFAGVFSTRHPFPAGQEIDSADAALPSPPPRKSLLSGQKMAGLLLGLACLLLLVTGCDSGPQPFTIAAASNLQPALDRVVAEYRATTGKEARVIYGSTGKLTAQIQEGAPYHVFLAADIAHPQSLVATKRATAAPKVFARGQLAMWMHRSTGIGPQIPNLLEPEVRHLAIANPETAPYGLAARQYLESLGFWKLLQHKIVYGESVAQTTQFIQTGAAEAGLTALSILLSLPESERGKYAKINPAHHPDIHQTWVILKEKSQTHADARSFVQFLESAPASAIFAELGYLSPK